MNVDDIERVAVLGAGSMGHGIAEVCALAGYRVALRDIEDDLVQKGYDDIRWSLEKLHEKGIVDEAPDDVLARIETHVDLGEAVADADLVVEVAPERLDLKREVFADLDDLAPADAILATNTSSLPITEIAAATDSPERVVGLHFFNPPVKMELVEVIYGAETSDKTAEAAYAFVEAIGKTPIYVRKDVRGFVVNSVLGPFLTEPAWMVSTGEATIEGADAAMVHERGYPMGPFELGDMTGIDVGVDVRQEAGEPIPPLMQEKYDAGDLGRKTGKGYYDYGEDGGGPTYDPADASGFDWLRVEACMINEAAKLVGNGVATPDAVDTGMRLGTGFPEGPCRRADALGLDTVLQKLRDLHDATGEDRYEPASYLVDLVDEGKTGKDAGAGFYDYGESGLREYQFINYELHDNGLLEIELNRPERLNALSAGLRDDMLHLLANVDVEAVRCVTIEGTGDRAFCAGADIGDLSRTAPYQKMEASEMHEAVANFPRPVIAKIQGYCLGGGNELALACDLRIATEDSEIGQPEINLGLIPGGGGTQRLARMLGEARAKELVFRGNRISATQAEEWGMINRAVPADEFEEVVAEFVEDIVTGPPVALKVAKQVMNEGSDLSLDAGLALESQGFGILLSTDDVNEGITAFDERRSPEFEGH